MATSVFERYVEDEYSSYDEYVWSDFTSDIDNFSCDLNLFYESFYATEEPEEPVQKWPVEAHRSTLPIIPPITQVNVPKQKLGEKWKPFAFPEPLEQRILDNFKTYQKIEEDLSKKLAALEKKKSGIVDQLKKAETTSTSYSSKWGAGAKDSAALVKRLNSEVDEVDKSIASLKKEIEHNEDKYKLTKEIVALHETHKETYEQIQKDKFERMNQLWGSHTPITRVDQLERYYDATVEDAGNDLLRVSIPDEFKVDRCIRELEFGGHTYIWREKWTTLLVEKVAFTDFAD
jgi:uncharacterized protein YukE